MSDLSKRRSRLYRQPTGKPVLLSKRDVEIFKLLNRYRYLRSTFLHAFLKGERSRFIRRLGQLYHEGGYIDRPKNQYNYANALYLPAVYELSNKGREVLRNRAGISPLAADRQAGSTSEARNFAHALMVCDILASIEIGCIRSGSVPTERDNEMTSDGLVGSRYGSGYSFFRPATRFITQEEIIGRAPCKEFADPFRVPVTVEGKEINVVPDGLFGLEYPNKTYRFFALEAEPGTMPVYRKSLNHTSYHRKLLAYREVLSSRLPKSHFGVPNLFILNVTTSEDRMKHMMEDLKGMTQGRGNPVFLFKVMKGDMFKAPPADGHILSEPWASPGHPQFVIGK